MFHLTDIGNQIAVGQHHALGQTSGSRRIRQHHHMLVNINLNLVDLFAHQRSHRRGPGGLPYHDHLADTGAFYSGQGNVEKHRNRQQQRRARILELETDLVGSVCWIDGGDRGANNAYGMKYDGVFGHVGRHDPKNISNAEPSCR